MLVLHVLDARRYGLSTALLPRQLPFRQGLRFATANLGAVSHLGVDEPWRAALFDCSERAKSLPTTEQMCGRLLLAKHLRPISRWSSQRGGPKTEYRLTNRSTSVSVLHQVEARVALASSRSLCLAAVPRQRAYVEAHADAWYILFAEHGALPAIAHQKRWNPFASLRAPESCEFEL